MRFMRREEIPGCGPLLLLLGGTGLSIGDIIVLCRHSLWEKWLCYIRHPQVGAAQPLIFVAFALRVDFLLKTASERHLSAPSVNFK